MFLRSISAWPRLFALFHVASGFVWLGRTLLFLLAVELITMPVTQDLWTWDRFLHGGQDFELGLLVIITFFCLMLLRAEQCKDDLGLLLGVRIRLPNLKRRELLSALRSRLFLIRWPKLPPSHSSDGFEPPLLI